MVETPRRFSTVPLSSWYPYGVTIALSYRHDIPISGPNLFLVNIPRSVWYGFAWKWGTVKKWQSIWVYKEAATSMMVGITGTNQPPNGLSGRTAWFWTWTMISPDSYSSKINSSYNFPRLFLDDVTYIIIRYCKFPRFIWVVSSSIATKSYYNFPKISPQKFHNIAII